MNSIKLKSRAKINLSIDILGKREDGYHLVEMIMQTIDLYDVVKIKQLNTEDIVVLSSSKDIPLDENNLVYKAAKLLKDKFNIDTGVEIFIEKNVPIAAGMAGGSSNAAAVLVGLNKIWELNLSEDELKQIGLKLGADVPFCISGGCSIAKGIGEELTSIHGLSKDVYIVVCKPNLFVSTKDVYGNLDLQNIQKRPNNKLLIDNLKEGKIEVVAENMCNVLEEVTSKMHHEIKYIENIMMQNGALGSIMSGSGPTVFGLYKYKEDALRVKDILEKEFKQTFVVTSEEKGVEVNG